MFEAVEVGRKIPKSEFAVARLDTHLALLDLQRRLTERNIPLIILISGVEAAGKSAVVRRLTTWFDARGLETQAFWDTTDEEADRPYYWRFWRRMPPRGSIAIMFGSWYTRPIIDHAFGRTSDAELDRMMARNRRLERMLTHDGMLLVKLWYHLSEEDQKRRLEKDRRMGRRDPHFRRQQNFASHYRHFIATAERAIRQTDTGRNPWHLIESSDRRYRDISTGRVLIDSIGEALRNHSEGEKAVVHEVTPPSVAGEATTILDHVDLEERLDRKKYRKRLKKRQAQFGRLAWQLRTARRHFVALFEGWDAAGKGGAIRRLLAGVDPRLFRMISVAAPTDEELAQHYLWRFWRQIPAAGRISVYDRSWYGRVLVERVESLATPAEWQRAYAEINDFEEQLVEHGIVLCKYWIHISPDEQLRRFKEREETPWKKHKITDEDWRNREKWPAYEQAVNDMIARTSTEYAPWTLIAGEDKYAARVAVLKHACKTLDRALTRSRS